MSMRKRSGGTIIDAAMERKGWDRSTDPHNLCAPMPKPKAEPICHCLPRVANQLGGMTPKMDLETMECRCGVCLKVIGPACRRREVVHLRGLLKLLETHPEMVDLDDCRAAGFLL